MKGPAVFLSTKWQSYDILLTCNFFGKSCWIAIIKPTTKSITAQAVQDNPADASSGVLPNSCRQMPIATLIEANVSNWWLHPSKAWNSMYTTSPSRISMMRGVVSNLKYQSIKKNIIVFSASWMLECKQLIPSVAKWYIITTHLIHLHH